MSDRIRKFQELARKAKLRAKAAKDAETKKTFAGLAEAWDNFAAQLEKQDKSAREEGSRLGNGSPGEGS